MDNKNTEVRKKDSKKTIEIKNVVKYCKLIQFSRILPRLRKDILANLIVFDYSKIKLIYFLLGIMDKCNFRIGNSMYETKGLSDIRVDDIKFNKKSIRISFIGKKKVLNTCTVKDMFLANLMANITQQNSNNMKKFSKDDTPLIFSFRKGVKKIKISSSSVNRLLKSYSPVISTKFFRTWRANVEVIKYLTNLKNKEGKPKNEKERKKNVRVAIKIAAKSLNNSAAICKKAYIFNRILNLYINNWKKFDEFANMKTRKIKHLSKYERILIIILKYFCSFNK